jgi:hypothetical protein
VGIQTLGNVPLEADGVGKVVALLVLDRGKYALFRL